MVNYLIAGGLDRTFAALSDPTRRALLARQDAERQRLERNIHDGAQQEVIALLVNLRLVQTLLARAPERAGKVLDAQAELISAQEMLIQARATRMIATFALVSAAGRLSAEDLGLDVKIHSADGYIASVEDVWAELRALDE